MITHTIKYFCGEDRRARTSPTTLGMSTNLVTSSTSSTTVSRSPTESEIKIKIKILQKNKV